jgi:hypothetical protein
MSGKKYDELPWIYLEKFDKPCRHPTKSIQIQDLLERNLAINPVIVKGIVGFERNAKITPCTLQIRTFPGDDLVRQ